MSFALAELSGKISLSSLVSVKRECVERVVVNGNMSPMIVSW